MGFFLVTQKRVRDSRDKRAISVRAIGSSAVCMFHARMLLVILNIAYSSTAIFEGYFAHL